MARLLFDVPVISCRICVVLLSLMMFSGCVSVVKLGDSPEQVRSVIRAGEVIKEGDRVVLKTAKQDEVKFKVGQIDERALRGDGKEVAIDDVVAGERRRTTFIGYFFWVYGSSIGIPIIIGSFIALLNALE